MLRVPNIRSLAAALVLSGSAMGCTKVTIDMRSQTSGDAAHTTIVYSGARGGDTRFADYGAIEGSILDD